LSVNTTGIDEVDMIVQNRSDPHEMYRFISALKEYQQDIVNEANRIGDNEVL